MTEIKFWGSKYVGTAEGDHGVFTNSKGTVYAGEIAGGYPCVGVATDTEGSTEYVECDANGKSHGRYLDCDARGDTVYYRYEHGSEKESAILRADGRCEYNWEACRADYAPFVALQAKVVPIKARPPLVPPTAAFVPHFFAPTASRFDRSNRPLFWHSQELATTHAEKVRTCRLRHQPAWAARHTPQQLPNKCTARPTGTTHRGGIVHHACDINHMRSAPLRRPMPAVQRSGPPCASAFTIICRTPAWSVAACGGLQHSVLHPTRCRCAPPSRFAPRTCTPAPSHGPNFDARSTRPQ
jgi:hypothetical protein